MHWRVKEGGKVWQKMPSSGSFLRQLSEREGWESSKSKRWVGGGETSLEQMEEINMHGGGGENGGLGVAKRVMVAVDQSSHSKQAMMWALTHVTNNGDLLTLLHIIPPPPHGATERASNDPSSTCLASSLGSLCKACKPEVEVEALVIQGPKLATVMSQVKKLDVSVLVLGQKKPSPLVNCLCGSSRTEEFVEECIERVECLTIGVRKQSRGIGGYLISTRWQKNFWLLA